MRMKDKLYKHDSYKLIFIHAKYIALVLFTKEQNEITEALQIEPFSDSNKK